MVADVLANQITLTRLVVKNEMMTEVVTGRLEHCTERWTFYIKTTQAAKCQTITWPPAEERQYPVKSED